jgi:hypothetical protein
MTTNRCFSTHHHQLTENCVFSGPKIVFGNMEKIGVIVFGKMGKIGVIVFGKMEKIGVKLFLCGVTIKASY